MLVSRGTLKNRKKRAPHGTVRFFFGRVRNTENRFHLKVRSIVSGAAANLFSEIAPVRHVFACEKKKSHHHLLI